jgi:proteic killer suppression protein
MIKSFSHKGLKVFFETGNKVGIQAQHEQKLRLQLVSLDNAKSKNDINVPAWKLHELKGDLRGHYSISVNGNWRLTFRLSRLSLGDYYDDAQSSPSRTRSS